MNSFSRFTPAAALLAASLLVTTQISAQPPEGRGPKSDATYGIVALDARDGAAEDISEDGRLAGWVNTQPGFRQPFHWQVATGTEGTLVTTSQLSLEGSGAKTGYATGVSSWICGNAEYADPNVMVRALAWDGPNSLPFGLPLGEEFTGNTVAMATNVPGLVVGFRFTFVNGLPTFDHTAVAWGIPLKGDPVGPLILGRGVALNVNETGFVVGASWTGDGKPPVSHAAWWQVAWDGATLTLVDSGLLVPKGMTPSSAVAVNDNHYTCGTINSEPFLQDGKFIPQPLVPLVDDKTYFTRNDLASAINNSVTPQVVGSVSVIHRENGTLNRRPVLWEGSTATDLIDAVLGSTRIPPSSPAYPGPDVIPTEPMAINDAGWIGGRGSSSVAGPPIVMFPLTP